MNTDSFFATNIRISIRFNMSTEVLNSASSNSMAKKRRGKSFAAECAGINHPICLDSDNNLIKCEHFNSRSQLLNKRLIKFRETQFFLLFLAGSLQLQSKYWANLFFRSGECVWVGKGKTAIEPANQKFN